MGRASSLAISGLLAYTAAAAPGIPSLLKRQDEKTNSTTFNTITPSAELKWEQCFQHVGESFQCANLQVPLDYEKPEDGTVDIAYMRYLVSEDAEDLMFNPGGPGEQGTTVVASLGEKYAKKWGMNFVSFDPRGVGFSGPRVRCDYSGGNTTALERRQASSVTPKSLKDGWEGILKSNTACSDANKDTEGKYIGTVANVQDMMHFTELQAALHGKDPKTAQINYYGVSYGTLMGQTLVALYPDRLRRVLLDGNVHGVSHYQGWEPSGNDDIAHGLFMFSKLCFEAGTEWCKLAEGMNSTEDVQARLDAAFEKLNQNPVEVGGNTVDGNSLSSQWVGGMSHVRGEGYGKIINATLAVENDDLETFLGGAQSKSVGNLGDPTYKSSDMLTMITATDIAGRFPWKTYESWEAAAMRLIATTKYHSVGYSVSNGLIGLAMDSFIPPPSQFFEGFEAINPSVPVLFVNNPGDPVTPRSSAYNMQRLFNGSTVFIQNSPGHGISNAPSKCTDDILAAYFADATIPEYDTWCEIDVEANYFFGGPDPKEEASE